MEKPAPRDIKETMEIFEYAHKMLDSLITKKQDDGKIDTAEIAMSFAANLPSGIRAYMGSGDVDDELKDLDDEEMMKLAMEGSKLAKKVLSLLMKPVLTNNNKHNIP